MKENYLPWAVEVSAFPTQGNLEKQLKFLIGFAILAPSGHNSQPWNFSITENTISILKNGERALVQSDVSQRQLFIGIGCLIENLVIAADYYGFESHIQYFPEGEKSDLLAKIDFKKVGNTKSNNKQHLILAIPKRRTNRNRYELALPKQDFLNAIERLASNDYTIDIVTDKEKMNMLADISNRAQIEVMDRVEFREELSRYVISNYSKSSTGMPGFTLGMPGLISLIASQLIKRFNMSRATKKQDDDLLKKFTPAFLVVSSKVDNSLSWIKAGQLFERIWLTAGVFGLSCAPLAAGVQVGTFYENIQEILEISSRPIVFSRIGYAKKVSLHSPRFHVSDLIVRDIF